MFVIRWPAGQVSNLRSVPNYDQPLCSTIFARLACRAIYTAHNFLLSVFRYLLPYNYYLVTILILAPQQPAAIVNCCGHACKP